MRLHSANLPSAICHLQSRLPRLWALLLVPLVLALALLPSVAAAHPLGNFTVNSYSRIEPGPQQVRIFYVLDMAEIAAFQEIAGRIDTDRDTITSAAELAAYLPQQVEALRSNLYLEANGAPLALRAEQPELAFPEGQGGLLTLRLHVTFVADLAPGPRWSLSYLDDNYADRIGWREVLARPAEGVALLASDVPTSDLSAELTSYPQGMLSSPLSVRSASLELGPASGAVAAPALPAAAPAGEPQRDPAIDTLTGLMRAELTPLSLIFALAIAFGLGAFHALSPGHGKTIVGAYLVGSRGSAYHAVLLGLTTTVTHTIGVFALGLITLFISEFVLPEQLYPWLGLLSGLMVLVIGLALLYGRWRQLRNSAAHSAHSHAGIGENEPHDHGFGSHTHAPAAPGGLGGLLALGVSGGLIPCPSALIILLGAIALGRVGLGLLLISAFSLGLAGVLTAIGILLVHARRLFERIPAQGRLLQILPVGSALFVTLVGAVITVQALAQTGLLHL
jgi:nickel/cobalt transporter (NicO) family protein